MLSHRICSNDDEDDEDNEDDRDDDDECDDDDDADNDDDEEEEDENVFCENEIVIGWRLFRLDSQPSTLALMKP